MGKNSEITTLLFCCSIEEGGAKMIDLKQYLTALKFKWILELLMKTS